MFTKDNLGKTDMNSTSTTTEKHQPQHCSIFPSSFFSLLFFFLKKLWDFTKDGFCHLEFLSQLSVQFSRSVVSDSLRPRES